MTAHHPAHHPDRSLPHRLRLCALTLILLVLLTPGCKEDSAVTADDPAAEGDIVLGVLWADLQEFKYINPGFSASDSTGAPWGIANEGIDLIASQNGARVLAPADGTVEEVRTMLNPKNNQWHVIVRVRFNRTFVYYILFQPRTSSQTDVAAQRSAITVTENQKVRTGDILGRVLNLSQGNPTAGEVGIHLEVWKGERNSCPQPYFATEALAKILDLLHALHPQAQLCYP